MGLIGSLLNFFNTRIIFYLEWRSHSRWWRGKGHDQHSWTEPCDRSSLESFHGARWGVALHCSMFQANGPGYHPRRGSNSERRVGGEGGEGRETAVWPSTKPPPTFSTPPLTSPPLPSQYLLLPPVLSLAAVFGCSMQNGLCLSALAWNKTKRGLGRRRMLALSQLPSTLSGDMVGKELKESVWLQISSAKRSAVATSTTFNPLFPSLLFFCLLLSLPHLTSSDMLLQTVEKK